MRTNSMVILLTAMIAPTLGIAPASAEPHGAAEGQREVHRDRDDRSPFRAAAITPEDVHLLLHIDDAAAIRREVADRPIARWITAMIEMSEFHQAWQRLAAVTGRDSADLFDQCFGRQVTLMHRRAGDGRDHAEWALVTEISPRHSTELLRRLEPRILRSRSRFTIYEVPEHDLLIARRGETMLVGPRPSPALMLDVLSRHGRSDGLSAPLINTPDFAAAREMTEGQVAVFIRHERPLGGHSAATLRIDGKHMRLQHRAEFESPPFARSITRMDIDPAPLQALEDHALLAMIEPADIGMGPLETFIVATLGEGLFSPAMRENMGERRIIVLGEVEGRQEAPRLDLLAPTITMALEVRTTDGMLEAMDQQLVRFVRQLSRRGGDSFSIDVPERDTFVDGEPRQVDISGATRWFTGSLPIARPMTLNWFTVDEPENRYAVFASHPAALQDTLDSLRRAKPDTRERRDRYQSCGTLNGVRISRHLESWAERPDLFHGGNAEADHPDPAAADPTGEEFRQTLKLMASLAAGIERLRWRLIRPSTHEMQLDLRIRLTEPESSRRE